MNDDSKKTGWQADLTGAAALLTAMAALIGGIGTLRDAWCKNIGVFCSGPPIEPSGPDSAVNPKPFTPIPYQGKGITFDPNNNRYNIVVNYRAERQEDAERIVGALKQAGYLKCDEVQTTLEEVSAPSNMKVPGATLIKTAMETQQVIEDVHRVVQFAIPLKAGSIFNFNGNQRLLRGDLQVDLF